MEKAFGRHSMSIVPSWRRISPSTFTTLGFTQADTRRLGQAKKVGQEATRHEGLPRTSHVHLARLALRQLEVLILVMSPGRKLVENCEQLTSSGGASLHKYQIHQTCCFKN